MKYIHEIKLEGDDEFTKRFNACSDQYQKVTDTSLTQEERDEHYKVYLQMRIALEMGL